MIIGPPLFTWHPSRRLLRMLATLIIRHARPSWLAITACWLKRTVSPRFFGRATWRETEKKRKGTKHEKYVNKYSQMYAIWLLFVMCNVCGKSLEMVDLGIESLLLKPKTVNKLGVLQELFTYIYPFLKNRQYKQGRPSKKKHLKKSQSLL